MADDLRLGLIGFGLRARSLSKVAHRPGAGARVTAVYDASREAAEHARVELDDAITVHDRLAGLLSDDLDAVLVASPDNLHVEHATAALQAGITTYLEKPMAVTVDDCDRILAAARDSRGRLYLGHNMRHMPFVQEMKRLIDSGAIGEPKVAWCRHFVGHGGDFYFRDWHADRRATTGLLLQKGAHDIDVLHWLMGGFSEQVSAMGQLMVYGANPRRAADDPGVPWRLDADPLSTWPPTQLSALNPVVDVEDVSHVLLALDNGTMATYQQCHFSPDYWRNYTIIGTEGRIENIGDVADDTVIKVWNRRTYGYSGGDRVIPVPPEPGGHGGADARIMNEFLRFVATGGPIETSPVAARNAVATAYAATESLRDGGSPRKVAPAATKDLEFFGR